MKNTFTEAPPTIDSWAENGKPKPSIEFMRLHFEHSVRTSKHLKDSTPLGTFEINGRFHHYMTPDTDTLWLGFALGMRVATAINRQP